jgi:hypothetical protein
MPNRGMSNCAGDLGEIPIQRADLCFTEFVTFFAANTYERYGKNIEKILTKFLTDRSYYYIVLSTM